MIEKWRVEYNTRRPHSSLAYRPPAPVAGNPYPPQNTVSQPLAVMWTLSFAGVQKLGQVKMAHLVNLIDVAVHPLAVRQGTAH